MAELPAVEARVDEEYINERAKKLAQELQRLGLLCLMFTGEQPERKLEIEPGLPVASKAYSTWSASQLQAALLLAFEQVQQHL